MPMMQMNGASVSQDQSNITRILNQAREDLLSQSHRVFPDLAILQDVCQTFLAGGIIDDRKYLVRNSLLISLRTYLRSIYTQAQAHHRRLATYLMGQVEKVVQLATSLPNSSTIRNDLSGTFINALWTTLQHPPISYLGNGFRYRTADGSNNVCPNPILHWLVYTLCDGLTLTV